MEKHDPMEEQDEFETRYINRKKVEYFNGKPVQYFNVEERFAEKESQRLSDRLAVERGEISADEMYKRNSIWTGLDWSQVTVIEPNGITWKPVEINTVSSDAEVSCKSENIKNASTHDKGCKTKILL